MKTIYLFFSLLFIGPNTAFAECVSSILFFPASKKIGLNPMFIIEGSDYYQKTIESFRKRTIYLESDKGETVVLELCEILKGQMQVTQAVLKPVRPLKPNTVYSLKYDCQSEREYNKLKRWNPETGENEKIYWKTSVTHVSPLRDKDTKISYLKNEYAEYGCGPDAHAIFEVSPANDGETWYRTEVTELSTRKKTDYYLLERESKLYVGHSMCGGPFAFKPAQKYQVRFTPVNANGLPGKTTPWKTFNSPYKNILKY
ncbi:hypothetical protein [Sinomicrobium weinanense]|uniref:Uncharacterized protein n=1 Tax=Sinomicrobium weinanense TaxID=2842200 RepID=A0A926JSX4_9FLAO|nr:hypothetical protein [Sinomicrobium weinanense]MBC9796903.1 hypothetical protein [Sinomicrobium weinanense]MBU3124211.1 hypothetical protein [Sinomicrobium weinanense]